ncbi:MAG: hypothetical protein NUW07_04835 [Candidatus Saccharicenans sp.]|jgi:TM2 domain-containing membrane protein YozV|nr:hypothetical protein [Candidatus Saccharicenans sp.]MDH7493717.1 hypothetical protein [Candidatus Saccharicenans sp.]
MKKRAITAGFLGWIIPGLGHIYLRRYWRGTIFLVAIGLMSLLGLVMGGKLYPLQADNPLTFLAFLSDLGNGLLYLLSRFLPIGLGELERQSFEFGTAYLAGAGLLNYLVALDAWDIARGKKS